MDVNTIGWTWRRRLFSCIWLNRTEAAVYASFIAIHVGFFTFLYSDMGDDLIGVDTPRPFVTEIKHYRNVAIQKYEEFMRPKVVEPIKSK